MNDIVPRVNSCSCSNSIRNNTFNRVSALVPVWTRVVPPNGVNNAMSKS